MLTTAGLARWTAGAGEWFFSLSRKLVAENFAFSPSNKESLPPPI